MDFLSLVSAALSRDSIASDVARQLLVVVGVRHTSPQALVYQIPDTSSWSYCLIFSQERVISVSASLECRARAA